MAHWHAVKGAQKGIIKTTCSQCGRKIRIYPDEPNLCWQCREKPNLTEQLVGASEQQARDFANTIKYLEGIQALGGLTIGQKQELAFLKRKVE